MTNKDYELIAKCFKATIPLNGPQVVADAMDDQWLHMRSVFATAFEATNPRFDRARFLAACE